MSLFRTSSLTSRMAIFTIVLFLLAFTVSGCKEDKEPAEEATISNSDNMEADEAAEAAHDTLMHSHGGTTHSHADDNNEGEKNIHELTIRPELGVRSLGNKDAPVKIQEFFSLTCNHCAAFHTGTYQELKKKYIDTGKVYFVYEEFPLNGPALYASMIARCLPEERYAGFIDLLLRNQDKWAFSGDFKASLKQNAALVGMSEEEFETCFNDKDLQKAIGANIQEASEAWGVSSTPSFVINNGEEKLRGGQEIGTFDEVIMRLSDKPVEEDFETTAEVQEEDTDPSMNDAEESTEE